MDVGDGHYRIGDVGHLLLQIGKLADGVLLVVREDMATVDAVYEAVKELNAAGIDIIGGVLNCV